MCIIHNKHDHTSCYLRPPFLGTPLVPSRGMAGERSLQNRSREGGTEAEQEGKERKGRGGEGRGRGRTEGRGPRAGEGEGEGRGVGGVLSFTITG